MNVVLVTGDRNWTNADTIREVIKQLQPIDLLIHGKARGVDTIAGRIAEEEFGIKVHAEPAKWDQHGKAAGPIRNRVMLAMSPDRVIAFHDHLEESRGTKDMVRAALKAGIEVRLFTQRMEVPQEVIPDLVN